VISVNRPTEQNRIYSESTIMLMGPVALAVADLERSLSFYEQVLGCKLLARNGNTAVVGSEAPLLLLTEQGDAPPRPQHTTGLYHVALLLPGRADLACILRHLLDCGYALESLQDHWISEAIYLSDPEGNGIELYRDRPRSAWPWQHGKLEATEPSTEIKIESLLAELDGTKYSWHGLPAFTRVGHIHLQVANLAPSAAFYQQVLGLEESITGMDGANFFAFGGYHHHIACNVWATLDAPLPPDHALGLHFFTLTLPEQADIEQLVSRARAADALVMQYGQSYLLRDPSNTRILLTSESVQDSQEVMALASVFGL